MNGKWSIGPITEHTNIFMGPESFKSATRGPINSLALRATKMRLTPHQARRTRCRPASPTASEFRPTPPPSCRLPARCWPLPPPRGFSSSWPSPGAADGRGHGRRSRSPPREEGVVPRPYRRRREARAAVDGAPVLHRRHCPSRERWPHPGPEGMYWFASLIACARIRTT